MWDNERERGYVRGTAISQACCCAGCEALSLGVSIATPGDVTSWPTDLVKSISLAVNLFLCTVYTHTHKEHKIKFATVTSGHCHIPDIGIGFALNSCKRSAGQPCLLSQQEDLMMTKMWNWMTILPRVPAWETHSNKDTLSLYSCV